MCLKGIQALIGCHYYCCCCCYYYYFSSLGIWMDSEEVPRFYCHWCPLIMSSSEGVPHEYIAGSYLWCCCGDTAIHRGD